MLKVDVLALGMLTCIRRAFDFMAEHYGGAPTLATIPAEDPSVYRMLSAPIRSASSRSRAAPR